VEDGGGVNSFDKFADWVADAVAHAGFFIFCALLVILWAPSIFIMPKHVPPEIDTWQLVINTTTTIITFLLVALLHNTQHRFEKAVNHRLECIEEELGIDDPIEDQGQKEKNT
jgi:low affinity Fe/Cu permease